MFLSDKQIKDYQKDGAIIIKDIFKDWIEPLRKGFEKVLNNPSKHGRENVNDDKGRFFEVDKEHIVTYALSALAKEQLVPSKYAEKAMKKYNIDKNKPIPTEL